MNKQQIIEIIRANRPLLEEFSVKSVSVFGSAMRGEARPDSDVDILVEFEPDARIGFFAFARLQRRLSEILGRPVDLVTPDALHKAMKNRILKEAVHAA
jgi:predicted nucleotidyltransferase